MTEFKVGDKVKRTKWEAGCHISKGQEVVIIAATEDGLFFSECALIPHHRSHFELVVTPAWQPEPGEMVEVSGDGKDWKKEPREFFAMDENQFVCRQLHSNRLFVSWPYARPIKRLVTFGDGQQYVIDRETEERWRREVGGQND